MLNQSNTLECCTTVDVTLTGQKRLTQGQLLLIILIIKIADSLVGFLLRLHAVAHLSDERHRLVESHVPSPFRILAQIHDLSVELK